MDIRINGSFMVSISVLNIEEYIYYRMNLKINRYLQLKIKLLCVSGHVFIDLQKIFYNKIVSFLPK